MDILPPPKRPLTQPIPRPTINNVPVPPLDLTSQLQPPRPPEPAPVKPYKRPVYRKPVFWIFSVLGLFVIAAVSVIVWYQWSLQPKNNVKQTTQFSVSEGEASSTIVKRLYTAGLIRSKFATRVYIEMSGNKAKLQAGSYLLSPDQSVNDIVTHIVSGKTDEQLVTIAPGRTLLQLREDLKKFGYSDADIDAAYNAHYTTPLFANKPVGSSLEGYIYPESFKVNAGEPLSKLFQRSFDELYKKLLADNMIETFKGRGLNLYQAMTLASIVQKEVSDTATQKQVAQVFYKRLADNMVLGSDVTFEYAAAQLGVSPSVDINSPYNTRINPGLPPGPIANMNYTALQAVANPAPGDYLFFVAGDDGTTYFSRTVEEHEANVAAHCHKLCDLY